MNDLRNHSAEITWALRNHKYDFDADNGVLHLPKQKLNIGGVFEHWVNGEDYRADRNLVVAQGRDNLLNIVFDALAQNAAYYLAPFSANVVIADNLTAATFTATQTEFTGYSAGTRVVWTPNGASSGQSVSNSSAPAAFTMNVAGPSTIWGIGMLTASAKSSTSGVLMSATLFAAARSGLLNGDILSVAYTLSATSS